MKLLENINTASLEETILGTLLASPLSWPIVQRTVGPAMFSSIVGMEVAPSLWNYFADAGPEKVSLSIFSTRFKIEADLLAGLVQSCDIDMVEEACTLLCDEYMERSFIRILDRGVKEWGDFDGWQDVFRWIDEERRDLLSQKAEEVTMATNIDGYLSDLKMKIERGDTHAGMTTGFAAIDEATGGYLPGDQIVVGARPGMGKTRYAIVSLIKAAMEGKHVVFFSKELSQAQIISTALSYLSGVPVGKMRTLDLDAADFTLLGLAAAKLKALSFDVYDYVPNSEYILSKCRELKYSRGLDMFAVDYIQLVYSSRTQRGENRTNELAKISASFKSLAKDLGAVSMILSQLGRDVDKRADKRPVDADLRDSGGLEADADLTLYLYNPEHYYPGSVDPFEVIISKNRFGKSAVFEMQVSSNGFLITAEEKQAEQTWLTDEHPQASGVVLTLRPDSNDFVPNPGEFPATRVDSNLITKPSRVNNDTDIPF